jgi:deoxycytidine triphosphate deaminase
MFIPPREHNFGSDFGRIDGDRLMGSPVPIHLGRWFVSFRRHALPKSAISDEELMMQTEELFKRHFVEFGSSLQLHPGQIIFAVTLQWLQWRQRTHLSLETDVCVTSQGLQLRLQHTGNSAYTGCLTAEILNSSETAVELRPGQFLGQVTFTPSTDNATTPEPSLNIGTGIYTNRRRPQIVPGYFRQLMGNDFRKL